MEVSAMSRLEIYKKELETAYKKQQEELILLLFQELMNQLSTYDEKSAFSDYYEELSIQKTP
jgi:hypothetical protein